MTTISFLPRFLPLPPSLPFHVSLTDDDRATGGKGRRGSRRTGDQLRLQKVLKFAEHINDIENKALENTSFTKRNEVSIAEIGEIHSRWTLSRSRESSTPFLLSSDCRYRRMKSYRALYWNCHVKNDPRPVFAPPTITTYNNRPCHFRCSVCSRTIFREFELPVPSTLWCTSPLPPPIFAAAAA